MVQEIETLTELRAGVPNEMVDIMPYIEQYPSDQWVPLFHIMKEANMVAQATTSTGVHTLIFRAAMAVMLDSVIKLEACKKAVGHKKAYRTYLMTDERNGLIKIGKAINPGYREKTLQSEQPRTKLLAMCQENIESVLHKEYAGFCVRGEWFSLEQSQIDSIIKQHGFKAKR